jgi:Na+/H+ antiporter NhaD/arsenite permease-like protein
MGWIFLIVALLLPDAALAAPVDAASLGWPWAIPFAGILLTIAAGPLLFPRVWHHHYGKFVVLWSALTLVPLAVLRSVAEAGEGFAHAMVSEYLSFIVLLFALYTVAGGVLVTGNLRGTPLTNATLLGIGGLMASVIGTTGAAMILIRPLLRANAERRHNVHVVVFFIFLVANIGGALSPLGDPPLFVGFLRGVDFFWTAQDLWRQTALAAGIVLAAFVALDIWFYRKELPPAHAGGAPLQLRVQGGINLILIAAIICVILLSANWRSDIAFDASGTSLSLPNLTREAALIVIALRSLWLTPNEHREANGFSWEPIREVAILFAGIFICIIPVLAMLGAGEKGAFAWLLAAVSPGGKPDNVAYFWLTGMLSAFLDNAPTYLVFFELAGGEAETLMRATATTLAAISMGAVYMGALTYIGNAPNFIVYAIATERGIKMPSFFGYMLWSGAVLLPVFVLLTLLFVR